MKTLGDTLREAREQKGLIFRRVGAEVDIDPSLISKFEKNERKPTKEQLLRLIAFYDLCEKDLTISWYSDKIVKELKYSDYTTEILKAADQKIKHYKSQGNEK